MHPKDEIKVLLIDDEVVWRHIITRDLESLGYKVTATADTFEKAVNLLNTTDFHLVILDINLGRKDRGVDLGKMINDFYKKPFIYITADVNVSSRQNAIDSGPSAFFVKPINLVSLNVAIINALESSATPKKEALHSIGQENSKFFFVKQGNKLKKLNWEDVVFMRAIKNYTILFCASDNTEYPVRSTLTKALTSLVPPQLQNGFIQLNRNEAIQISYLLELKAEEAKTAYGTFTVTDGYLNKLRSLMNVLS